MMYEGKVEKNPAPPKSTQKECIARAMRLLLYKNRSECKLREKLAEDQYAEEDIEAAIEYVKSFGYLNDRRYAESYILGSGSNKSKAAIKRYLFQQGLDAEVVDDALALMERDEDELVRELLHKRYGDPHSMDDKEYRRACGFLARRGFAPGIIQRELRRYTIA